MSGNRMPGGDPWIRVRRAASGLAQV